MSEDIKKELLDKLLLARNSYIAAANSAERGNENAWIRHEQVAESLLDDVRELIISA